MEPQTKENTAAIFRTWYVQLPLDTAQLIQKEIKAQLEWSSQTWYDRIRGRIAFRPAEKFVIEQKAVEHNLPHPFTAINK